MLQHLFPISGTDKLAVQIQKHAVITSFFLNAVFSRQLKFQVRMCLLFIAASYARKRNILKPQQWVRIYPPSLKMCVKNVTEQLKKFVSFIIMEKNNIVFQCHLFKKLNLKRCMNHNPYFILTPKKNTGTLDWTG